MRGSIISLSIIVFVIFLCFFTTTFTETICEKIYTSLDACQELLLSEDFEAAAKEIKNVDELFQEKSPIMKTFFSHGPINEISHLIYKTKSLIYAKKGEEAINEITSLKWLVNNLITSENITVQNIL